MNIYGFLGWFFLLIFTLGVVRRNYQLIKTQPRALEAMKACELIVAVKHCMMFSSVHADWMAKEILDKHGVASIQLLAKKAQDTAERALGEQPKEKIES